MEGLRDFLGPEHDRRKEEKYKTENKKERFLDLLRRHKKAGIGIGCLSFLGYGIWEDERTVSPEEYIQYAMQTETLSQEEQDALYDKLVTIETELSPQAIADLMRGDEAARASRDSIPYRTTVSGFEEEGFSSEAVEQLIQRAYPQQLLRQNLSSVILINVERTLPSTYGSDTQMVEGVTPGEDVIHLYASPQLGAEPGTEPVYTQVGLIDSRIAHGVGHIIDGINNNNLSAAERVEFLYDILGAYNRYGEANESRLWRADYLKNRIKIKDNQLRKYVKLGEWWPVIYERFINEPEMFREYFPSEYRFVVRKMQELDPTFDPIKALAERRVARRLIAQSHSSSNIASTQEAP